MDNDTRSAIAIDDQRLSAWVDGELGPAEREAVRAWLADHPEDAARVQAFAADRVALAALYAPVLAEPAPAALQRSVWRRAGAPRWAWAASAAALLIGGTLLGAGAAWHWQPQRLDPQQAQQHAQQLAQLRQQLAPGTAQGWVQRAAFAHSVYVAEPRHAVEVKAQEEHLARWLTRRIAIPVKLFDLREQGFELVGGRLLPDGPGKSAQLMYEDAQKRRVTVYLRKPEEGTDAAFRFEQQGAVGLFYWVEEGAGYALVGELPKAALLALAQAIYQQHPGALPAVPASVSPAAPAASPAGSPPVSPSSSAARPG